MKKKILLFAPSNGGTTIAAVSLNLYKALLKLEDVEVKVVVIFKYPHGRFDFGEYEYFDTVAGGNKLFSFFRKISWYKKIKKEFSPDICINTLFICSIISVLSGGNDKKIGIFHSPHAQAAVKGKLSLFLSFLSYKFIYPKLTKLFCVSQEIRDAISSQFKNIPADKLEVVYNVHDIEHIVTESNEEIEGKNNEIFQKDVILYCGRFDKNKAPDRLLQAFIDALPQLPASAQLVFIGKDYEQMWPVMEQTIKTSNVQHRVHYLGLQNNPYKFIKRSKVLVSTSYSEGLPGVLIEALLLKVPVITTNSSKGIWEILSCSEKYDSELSANLIIPNAIITPNLSAGNAMLAKQDVTALSEAIIHVFQNDIRSDYFPFMEKVKAENVIKQFLI